MGQALYRAYRPKRLEEVVGQEHITKALTRALQQDKLSHAYLFTGPRGVGKTSIARILAHEVNQLPYTDESTHLDIIEIDAASNRRIDEIRELRDKVNVAPTSARYKVYIIDEVHMLTREAFNALLKTLEEPPAHVIFILATTEVHKLPDTIVSRTQRYGFKPVAEAQVVDHLRTLADQESIAIDDQALGLIARHGEGSFRDSISLLDQLRGYDETVGKQQVEQLLGIPSASAIAEIVAALEQSDAAEIVRLLETLQLQGYGPAQIATQLAKLLRERVLSGQAPAGWLHLIGELAAIPAAYNPAVQLELNLLNLALANAQPAPAKPAPTPKPQPTQAAAKPVVKAKPEPAAAPEPKAKPVPAETPALATAPLSSPFTIETWPQILAALKQTHNTLYSVIRMAKPAVDDGQLTLRCGFAFHQKRLSEPKNQTIITEAIYAQTGQRVGISCVLEAADPAQAAPVEANPLTAINDVFGGGEVING